MAQECNRLTDTDRQADNANPFVTIGRIYSLHGSEMLPNNKLSNIVAAYGTN